MTTWGGRGRGRGRVESLDELCVESFVLMRELLSRRCWDLGEIHQLSISTIFFSNPFILGVLLLVLTLRQRYEDVHITNTFQRKTGLRHYILEKFYKHE